MSLAALKQHLAGWREWELNPVVVKELRQGVRSWTVTGMLLLFLVILFITTLGFLITQSFEINGDLRLGGTVFSSFLFILAAASLLFIPLYTGVRVAVERQENNTDLLYVTTLSPFRIIHGKFLCSAYIAVLFFSACLPFMAFTNLLRGVDLPTVFYLLFLLFLLVCAANAVAIFLACLPLSRAFKILLGLGGAILSAISIAPVLSLAFELMRSGVGAMMTHGNFWYGTLTYVLVITAITGLLFVLSVALISPPSANRALAVRVYLTILWVLGGVICLFWVCRAGQSAFILPWVIPTFIIMMLALVVTISNADELSLRVRRTIPRAHWKRWLAFLFYNGAAGGLLWAAGILGTTGAVMTSVLEFLPTSGGPSTHDMAWYLIIVVYAFAYALTAVFIHRQFMPHRPPKVTGLLVLLLVSGWAIAPSIFLFFVNQLSWRAEERFQPGNVFNLFSTHGDEYQPWHLAVATGWLVVIGLVNAKWFLRQVSQFTPAAPKEAPVPPAQP